MTEPGDLVQGWFAVSAPEEGVFTIEEPLHEEQVKSYLVVGSERAILIDTGMGVGDIRTLVADLTDRPVTVVNSHVHWDHIGGNGLFAEILIHPTEADVLRRGVPNERLRPNFTPDRL
nr:MBL fold metallo-hydrolase [Chloroflexota bacterium]